MQASAKIAPHAELKAGRAYRVVLVGKGQPDRGGIAAFLVDLQKGDLQLRHELRFLNLYREGDRAGGRLTTANVRRTVRAAGRVFRAARAAELVHIHSALVPLMTLARVGWLTLAARLAGARVLVHVHSGMVEPWLARRSHRILARMALAAAERVVTVSSGTDVALEPARDGDRV